MKNDLPITIYIVFTFYLPYSHSKHLESFVAISVENVYSFSSNRISHEQTFWLILVIKKHMNFWRKCVCIFASIWKILFSHLPRTGGLFIRSAAAVTAVSWNPFSSVLASVDRAKSCIIWSNAWVEQKQQQMIQPKAATLNRDHPNFQGLKIAIYIFRT